MVGALTYKAESPIHFVPRNFRPERDFHEVIVIFGERQDGPVRPCHDILNRSDASIEKQSQILGFLGVRFHY